MTRSELVRMAAEARLGHHLPSSGDLPGAWRGVSLECLERFADLVSKAEREACAKVCEDMPLGDIWASPGQCAEAIRLRE